MRRLSRFTRRSSSVAFLAAALILAGIDSRTTADSSPAPDDARPLFFPIERAKDCVFDSQRQRLYVTNEKQVVVIDAKERKTLKSLDLPGKLQACDITPDLKHLAVAQLSGQLFYWVNLDDLEVSQVRFRTGAGETGVFDLCTGEDGSVLLSMASLGPAKLRRYDPKTNSTTEAGSVGIRPDAVISASGDRRFAAVAEGNISSGPLKVYDFQKGELRDVLNMGSFSYEIACSSGGEYFARPQGGGCELFDAKGGRLGNLTGKPVICAAFHPKANRLFIMRDGETSIQEFTLPGQKLVNEYPLDKALRISGEVNSRVVVNVQQTGKNSAVGNVRRVRSVNYKTFQSGRVRVSDDGEKVCAVVPTGVYLFATKKVPVEKKEEGTKFKVIESK